MRIATLTIIVATALLAACMAHGGVVPASFDSAQDDTSHVAPGNAAASEYVIRDLGTLGAPGSGGNSINDLGWVSGFSKTKNGAVHAALWRGNRKTDLGTAGGGTNSGVEWPVPNTNGLIVGISETSKTDPLKEGWSCGAFIPTNGHTCVGFAWQNNTIAALATLGGNNGYAASANDTGVVVGWAETAKHDSSCAKGHVLQFLPVTWSGSTFTVKPLATLKGDPDGAATAINDAGVIAGISGICDQDVGRFSARHAVVWNNGVPTDIGSLGGKAWNTPAAMNDKGEVVGFSDLRGDESGNPNFHAFLWIRGGKMRDLGTLPGDTYSEALGINDRGQIVGVSYTAGFASSRGFIWQNGKMTDANLLVKPGKVPISIQFINDINANGQIAGGACSIKGGTCSGASWAFIGSPAT